MYLKDPKNSRYYGFCHAMEQCGLSVDTDLLIDGIYPYNTYARSGYQAMKYKLSENRKFTAVIAINDLLAIGATHAINESGRRIPEDISIIGCDDIMISEFLNPSLTTLRISAEEIGSRTMYALYQKLCGLPVTLIYIDAQLIIRGSTSKVT